MTRTALYRCFDRSNVLLYVGISSHPDRRLAQHLASAPWAGRFDRLDVEWFDSRQKALSGERRAIHEEGPEFNKTHLGLPAFDNPENAHAEIISAVNAYADAAGLSPRTVFRKATGNPRLYDRFVREGEYIQKTINLIEAHMAADNLAKAEAPA